EQLINTEARQAERLSISGEPKNLEEAQRLINDAVERGEALLKLASSQPTMAGKHARALLPNTERQSILGSTYKRQAAVLLHAGKPWSLVCAALERARVAYAAGEPDVTVPGWDPYTRINRLQLDALLGNPITDLSEIELCQQAARTRFHARYDFFDA